MYTSTIKAKRTHLLSDHCQTCYVFDGVDRDGERERERERETDNSFPVFDAVVVRLCLLSSISYVSRGKVVLIISYFICHMAVNDAIR